MPVDHEIFEGVSTAQWLWYFHSYSKDQDEEFERGRDMIEYHASFIEPEAVRKIRDSRERAIEIPEDKFMAGIEFLFGKPLRSTAVARPKDQELHKINLSKVLSDYNSIQKEKSQVGKFSYKDWTNLKIG